MYIKRKKRNVLALTAIPKGTTVYWLNKAFDMMEGTVEANVIIRGEDIKVLRVTSGDWLHIITYDEAFLSKAECIHIAIRKIDNRISGLEIWKNKIRAHLLSETSSGPLV
jgi:hypothetical protein